MIDEKLFKFVDKIAYRYHKSKVLTLERVMYEQNKMQTPTQTYYYSAMSKVCHEYKLWQQNRIRELYAR